MRQLEIELKLSVLPEAIKRIREKIICFRYTHFSLHKLSNIYFETVDHQLRRCIEGLRLANKSKAEQGYSLVQHSDYIDTKYFLPHCNWHTMPIEQGLNQLLAYWQHYEECWLDHQPQAKQNLSHLLVLIQRFLVHYSHSIPHFVQASPLKKITALLATTDNQPQQLCYSADWLRCKLAFTQWLTALTLS